MLSPSRFVFTPCAVIHFDAVSSPGMVIVSTKGSVCVLASVIRAV